MNKSHGDSVPFANQNGRVIGLRVHPRDQMTLDGGQSRVKQELPTDPKGLLIRKLGEKLAFERAFLRLYEAYLKKRWGAARSLGNPLAEGLQEFDRIVTHKRRQVERLREMIWDRGGDPNALVPSEELSAIAQLGIVTVFTSADSSLKSLAHAVRVVELAGRSSGLYLARIAAAANDNDLFEELQSMQATCDYLINQFAVLSSWESGQKKSFSPVRSIRRHFTTLH